MRDNNDHGSDGDLYVSPEGDDDWSGAHPDPTGDGDGPFRTLERTIEEVRFRRRAGTLGECTVWLRGGRYELSSPLEFGPDDGNVTYAAYEDEEPLVSGGREIDGWEETTVNGVDAWKTTVDGVADGDVNFRQLWMDGERRFRPRVPDVGDLSFLDDDDFNWIQDVPDMDDTGFLHNIFHGNSAFIADEGDVGDWRAPDDVEAVVCHYWLGQRLAVENIDPDSGLVDLTWPSGYGFIDGMEGGYARYYFENVFEALSDPGEWYLDRATGECYYVPFEDEDPEDVTVIAPVLDELVRIEGEPHSPVEDLRFKGVTFAHTRYDYQNSLEEQETADDEAASLQAAAFADGAISLQYAQNCAFADGSVAHIGSYAMEFEAGTRQCSVTGNDIHDLGAGGIALDGGRSDETERTGHNQITDNCIGDGGHVHHAGVGVLARNVFDTVISHNHIHDFYYTGVSCGWEWGYDVQIAADNRIEHNHIHDLGKELLSDMGGIYTLGILPGTVIRGNHIHDVHHWNYGGRGIYLDEGSSHILVENNVCREFSEYPFHIHYGRENTVKNNVFAYGGQGQISLTRGEYTGLKWRREQVIRPNGWDPYSDRYPNLAHLEGPRGKAFTLLSNVVLADDQPLLAGSSTPDGSALSDDPITSEANLFWDESGEPTCVDDSHGDVGGTMSFQEWQSMGNDATSLVADPGVTVDSDGVEFDPDSAAFEIGFEPFELDAGPREE